MFAFAKINIFLCHTQTCYLSKKCEYGTRSANIIFADNANFVPLFLTLSKKLNYFERERGKISNESASIHMTNNAIFFALKHLI